MTHMHTRNRILIIGPVLPFRGGIAQHTTMLHRALNKSVACLTISFTRQYPNWLFPGTSDEDASLVDHREPDVEYLIDSVNPLTWLNAIKRGKAFNPGIVIFPWWHVYWTPCFAFMASAFKRSGIEVVFLCHNSDDHDSSNLKRFISYIALKNADRFLVHTKSDQNNLKIRFPHISSQVSPIPPFNHFPQPTTTLERRAKLELLFFGFVRPYKGLDILLQAVAQLQSDDVFLSVVGEFWDGYLKTLEMVSAYGLAEKVEIVAEYAPAEKVAAYFARCDIVVLPYRSGTGSAVIPLAYHYKKPVIATRVGGLPEVVEDGITGTLIPSSSVEALVTAIRNVLVGAVSYDTAEISRLNARLNWETLAQVALGTEEVDKSNCYTPPSPSKRTHAILDSRSREHKAQKIAALTQLGLYNRPLRILEVGTGSGAIAAYFAHNYGHDVYAIDVVDERVVYGNYHFQLVNSTTLPFANGMFDLIISNHVIEHVGESIEQQKHLGELYRCLKADGIMYLAVPNKWRIVEPHYKLPILSWLPQRIASMYTRLFRKSYEYDCAPLSKSTAMRMLRDSGFDYMDVTFDAITLTAEIEGGMMSRHIARIPHRILRVLMPIVPTLIFVCRKSSHAPASFIA